MLSSTITKRRGDQTQHSFYIGFYQKWFPDSSGMHNSGFTEMLYCRRLFVTHLFSFAFPKQSELQLDVNRLNTEESVIPYDYHHFDFCPIDETNAPVENLGQVVFGERIRHGPYRISFLEDVKCAKVSGFWGRTII